ncbi:hypothetical protein MMC22_002295 [Lobaria immixta]|nr:hypothetical protein [Lobaria immixta]
MAESNSQSDDEVTPPNDQAAYEAASENPSISNSPTENQSVMIAPYRSRLGFLSLPAEIRLLVYREMYLPNTAAIYWRELETIPALLATCKLIMKEAFAVLWGENPFEWGSTPPPLLPNPLHRVVDAIQTLEVSLPLGKVSATFIDLIHRFGDPARIRHTLKISFVLYNVHESFDSRQIRWFISGLGRFTNFRVVEIAIGRYFQPLPISNHLSQWVAKAMQTRLGPCKPRADKKGLVWHPQAYLNAQRPQALVDWIDLLEGIRLDRNRDGASADSNAI